MKITTVKSTIRAMKNDNPKFYIKDGAVLIPRAGFEITKSCPKEYKTILIEAMQRSWIKPVAYLKDTESFWETFQ